MAKLNNAFDSSRYENMSNFEPIPRGKYPCQVTKSEMKKTKDKKGQYLEFEYTVIKGEFKGRKIWSRMNIVNASPVAVEIAQKELATLIRACGKGVIQDTQQLHGIPFILNVGIQPAKGDYPASNKVMGYEPANGGKSGAGSNAEDSNPFGDEEKKAPAKTTKKKKPEPEPEEEKIEGEDEVNGFGDDDDSDGEPPWGDDDGDDGFEDEIPE